MDALLLLKSTIGERINGVQKELKTIAGYFEGYEEQQKERKSTLLNKGLEFYTALLKFDGSEIIQAIEEEIAIVN